jgi:MFS family permease
MITTSIVVGRLITRIGRYKAFLVAGPLVMGVGYYLLTRLHYGSTQGQLTVAMIIVGLGLGAVMQTYTLVVQNASTREDLGVATSVTQLSRSLGATVGTAVFGTILTTNLAGEISRRLPPGAGDKTGQLSGGSGVGAVLDPNALTDLPNAVATGIREGLAAAMHPVFVLGLPILAVALIASLFIKEIPLRTRAFADEDAPAGEETQQPAPVRDTPPPKKDRRQPSPERITDLR